MADGSLPAFLTNTLTVCLNAITVCPNTLTICSNAPTDCSYDLMVDSKQLTIGLSKVWLLLVIQWCLTLQIKPLWQYFCIVNC